MTTTQPRAWSSLLPALSDAAPDPARAARQTPDQRDGAVYVLDDDVRLAVDVALASRRPLLLRGDPGSGKSSLAAFLARNLGWRYYEHVVTSRTRPRDLLWTFDAVRKLADASARDENATSLIDHHYVEPGVLWWAFDPVLAARRGAPDPSGPPAKPAREPDLELNETRDRGRAVVLIDEIDKADPDLPNGLLVPLGSSEFWVEEIGRLVTRPQSPHESHAEPGAGSLLVIITTNEERELPPAFLRRCIAYELKAPSMERLVEIGRRHLQAAQLPCGPSDLRLLEALARKIDQLRMSMTGQALRPPSPAEFLDAVFACRALDVDVDEHDVWPLVERLILRKDVSSSLAP